MTKKQEDQFNKMLAVLKRISKNYMTPDQIRKECDGHFGPEYEETLQMAYENIQQEAKDCSKGIRPIVSKPPQP